jgi:hypothetical protein
MLSKNPNQFHPLIPATFLVFSLLIGNSFGEIRSLNQTGDKGAQCSKRHKVLHGPGRPVRLASSDLMDRVVEKRPVERPGLLGKNNLRGVVSIEVLINKQGRVVCAHGVEGHPIAIGPAIRSVREWTFKPYFIGRKPKSVAGVLTIPYNFGS